MDRHSTQLIHTSRAYRSGLHDSGYLLGDDWYWLKVSVNLQTGMEEFLLTLHLMYPVTFVQGTRELGTLFWVETIL